VFGLVDGNHSRNLKENDFPNDHPSALVSIPTSCGVSSEELTPESLLFGSSASRKGVGRESSTPVLRSTQGLFKHFLHGFLKLGVSSTKSPDSSTRTYTSPQWRSASVEKYARVSQLGKLLSRR
jgi:hypothetical protein